MKNYSIKDIAKLSGVSVATVSRVINNNGRFSEETRKKVLAAIEETGYKMNYSAKSLRMNKSFSIGILVPDIGNYFFSSIVQTIEEILFDRGYSTIICNTSRNQIKETAYLEMLQSKGVDGLIVISGAEAFGFEHTSAEKKIPYICIDREPQKKEQTIFISSNHYQGAFEATEKMILSGCKQPVIAMHNRKSTSSKERFAGFVAALEKNGYHFNEKKHIIHFDAKLDSYSETLKFFLKENPTTDGIFAINDSIGIEILSILNAVKKTIPDQIRLIGFDDSPFCRYSKPTMSSVQQNIEKIAHLAVDNLINLIEQKIKTGETIIVPVTLSLRNSSK